MRGLMLGALLLPVAVAGSSLASPGPGGAAALNAARSEWAAAESETRRLEAKAAKAADQALRLALERQAAASAIASAEARISAASAELALRQAAVEAARGRLAERQRPVAALIAGLVNLERRPPLLTLASNGSVDELVRTRALLGALIPHVRSRSESVSAELARARALEASALESRRSVEAARADLERRRQRFATLERAAIARSQRLGQAAVSAGDTAIVAGVGLEELESRSARAASARQIAARLAALPPAPPRPFGRESEAGPALGYSLPADAAVIEGQGSVSDTGIRSRGLRLDTARGARLAMPADGTIVFTGPFRSHDGVVIVEHGDGWMTMLINARSQQPRGTRLRRGEPLGVALGDVTLELSRGGRHVSPALAAARSRSLSIQAKRR